MAAVNRGLEPEPLSEIPTAAKTVAEAKTIAEDWRHQGRRHFERGDVAVAVRWLRRAVALAPESLELNHELAVMLLALGRFEDAVAACRRELAHQPGHAGALYNLGWALRRLGRGDAAATAFLALTRAHPDHVDAWYNLGNIRLDEGALEEAAAAYRTVLALNADFAPAVTNLGVIRQRQGAFEDAAALYRQALDLEERAGGDFGPASNNLGNVLTASGRAEEALPLYRGRLKRLPGDTAAALNLAVALRRLDRLDEAVTTLRQALSLAPAAAELWNLLGVLHLDRLDFAAAEVALRRALTLASDFADALNHLGMVLGAVGRNLEALACYRRAHVLEPENAIIHSNLLFLMRHMGGLSEAEVFAEHRRFGAIQEGLVPKPAPFPARPEGRRLRLGYVSPDFCDHAMTMLFEPVLRRHDRAAFELFCYHTDDRTDAATARLRTLVDHWRSLAAVPAAVAAEMIRSDGIDILVDLAGHTKGNGLPIFARKPAPIQASWLGYPGTTGLSRVDYRITDIHLDPPGATEAYYTECLTRLDRSFTLRPPENGPNERPLPLLEGGGPRFGAFNRPHKLNETVVATWSRLLAAVPKATLVLVAPGSDLDAVREDLTARFTAHGTDRDRLTVVGTRPLAAFLELVGGVDVALDPFPYCGGTTSFLTLWMGVPLVTLAGADAAARVTAVMLRATGLETLIAATHDDYVDIAGALVRDVERLAALRRGLRSRLLASSLCDEAGLVAALEDEYRRWWRRYCHS